VNVSLVDVHRYEEVTHAIDTHDRKRCGEITVHPLHLEAPVYLSLLLFAALTFYFLPLHVKVPGWCGITGLLVPRILLCCHPWILDVAALKCLAHGGVRLTAVGGVKPLYLLCDEG
jgi:hypothetical protein